MKLLSATPASVVLSRRQLMRGSWTKASSMAITESLFSRRTRTTFSHVYLQVGMETIKLCHVC